MKNFKKNQIVIFVIALMLVTAGYLNFTNQQANNNLLPTSSLADSEEMAAIGDATLVSANQAIENGEENTQQVQNVEENSQTSSNTILENTVSTNNQTTGQEDSYFVQSRLDRDTMYSQMLENYQQILETDNLDSEEKVAAQEEIKRINNEKNAIMIAENLIKTKGFEDVILFMNNGNVTGVIKAEKLEEEQISQIQNIITRQLDVKVNKINISNKK